MGYRLKITKDVTLTSVFWINRPLQVIGDEEQLYRLALNVVTKVTRKSICILVATLAIILEPSQFT